MPCPYDSNRLVISYKVEQIGIQLCLEPGVILKISKLYTSLDVPLLSS